MKTLRFLAIFFCSKFRRVLSRGTLDMTNSKFRRVLSRGTLDMTNSKFRRVLSRGTRDVTLRLKPAISRQRAVGRPRPTTGMTCIIALAVFTAALLLLPAAANAQTPGLPFSIYAGGGLSIPANPGEFTDSTKTGYHGMAGVGFNFAPTIELIGKGEYTQFGYDDFPSIATDGGNYRIWMFGVDARVGLGAPGISFRPYFFAGAGFASIERTEFTFVQGVTSPGAFLFDEQDELYYNFGGGLQFKLLPMVDLFAQVKYVNISTSPEAMNFVPITVGVKVF